MPVLTLFALAGIGAGLWLPVFNSVLLWPVAAVITIPLLLWLGGPAVCAALIAMTVTSLHCHWYQLKLLPLALVQEDIFVRGVVADLPRDDIDSVAFRFVLEPDAVHETSISNLLLRIYAAEPRPQPGELWEFRVRLKRPLGTVNIGGFDSESWALWNDIHASGYVRDSPLNRRVAEQATGTQVLRMRASINQRIEAVLAGHSMLPVVQGITIAATQGIDADTWRAFRDSGTIHLISISGLHIALVAAFLWYPGRLVGSLLHSFGVLGDPLVPARILALAGAVGYGALAGFPIPTLRTCLMIALILLLGWRHRGQFSGLGVLCAVLLLILLENPLAILGAGLWLSFLAVGLLYTCIASNDQNGLTRTDVRARYLYAVKRFITVNCYAQYVLGAGLVFPSLLFFAQISIVSFIANPIAIPVFTFLILPLSLLGAGLVTTTVGAGEWLLIGAATVLDWLFACIRLLADLPGAVWHPAPMDPVAWVLVAAASFAALLKSPLPGRLIGLGLLCIFLSRDKQSTDDLVRVQVMDVGQGLAVLVQTANHSLLYDAGARWRSGDSGQTVVVPVLQASGIEHLDALIVSHDDVDHSGGVHSTLQSFQALSILAPTRGYSGIETAVECRAGKSWEWDGVVFSILHPGRRSDWSDNNASCVLLIEAGGRSILLPGDIEAAVELQLLGDRRLRNVDLLVAPHHGSRTSSSKEFVEAIAADYVVFSAGYANRWGFPKADIVERWVTRGACTFATAQTGALEFRVSVQDELVVGRAARASLSRPWVLRNPYADKCRNTTNSGLAGV